MNVYIIRHADAGDPAKWQGDDAERPLSELGWRQARALGAALRARNVTFGAVVSSPLVRTRETAEGLLEAWPGSAAMQFCDLLAPAALKKRRLSKHLSGLGVETVAIVGHDPDLPEYLGWLVNAEPEAVHLAKGGAALVRYDGSASKAAGRLVWMITPEWFMTGE